MEIERLELDGFGRFHEARWSFKGGATVFLGANEAGKTTLLNALRALLFGFEQTRDGRTWYPPLAGGRRGGRLTLRLASGERWSVERHGERGGGGALAVRAPNGNQGGQETLDRLLHGADRDLFNNVFAFGLGELQSFSTLSTDAVRGRIYGAGAGLGGTSAVDLERRLRQAMDSIFLPRGRERPLNVLLARIEQLRGEIADLARQPEEHATAHVTRSELEARATELRLLARGARERVIRLQRLRSAAPLAGELASVDRELAEGDPTLDALPADAVALLDRRLDALMQAKEALVAIDEQLREAQVARSGLQIDESVLAEAEEIAAVGEERSARAGEAGRWTELQGAEARHAAAVDEQRARVGGWDEGRLLALDTSIVAVEETRQIERLLGEARGANSLAEQRRRAGADELAAREREAGGGVAPEGGDDRAAMLRRLDQVRLRQAAAEARGTRHTPRLSRPVAIGLGALLLVAGAGLGALVGAAALGALAGALLGIGLVILAMSESRPSEGAGLPDIMAQRSELLAGLSLPPDASDDRIVELAEQVAAARARRELVGEQRVALEARRDDAERLTREVEQTGGSLQAAEAAWRAWLDRARLPAELSPEAARQVLAAAGTARHATIERDQHRASIAALVERETAFAARLEALLGRLGQPLPSDAARREAALAGLADLLERSRDAARRAPELDARMAQLATRREAAQRQVTERQAAAEERMVALGCADAHELRVRDAAAAARRLLQLRSRELRAGLSGIAGGSEVALTELLEAVRTTDLTAVEAEEPEAEAELDRLEAEEREVVSARGALEARMKQLEAAEEIGARRQALAALEGQAADLARQWAVRAVALRLFEETRSRYERERQPDVIRAAEGHFERFTGGRYQRIVAPPGDGSVRVETEGGEGRITEELSRGTAEQLYLALRFGLIEEFARQAEPLPVVMDDILVNFDAERALRAASAIRDLATRHQVFYFAKDRLTAEMLDPEGTRTITLD